MKYDVTIIGAGLAGSEAALVLASYGFTIRLVEMRPAVQTEVHKTGDCAELVCSNSLKSMKADSAAGLLKEELRLLGSPLYEAAIKHRVAAGGALAVDRDAFSQEITALISKAQTISYEVFEATDIDQFFSDSRIVLVATGPLTTHTLSDSIRKYTGSDYFAFFDAAAPIVMADSLDYSKVFRKNRYEDSDIDGDMGDYLNAPFTREEYDVFIDALLSAQRVIAKDFETKELFQACQPIEELARSGRNTPRFGTMKPVGLADPRTGERPWAVLQLRSENQQGTCYNLVGFQTNLTFPEQARVFRLIPGLEHAEFARYGVMHKNTFINSPDLLDENLLLKAGCAAIEIPLYFAGQITGTEGYTEAIRSGHHAALSIACKLKGLSCPIPSANTVFGALLSYSTNPETKDYQPMHVNFGLLPPLETPVKNKSLRYVAYAKRAMADFEAYVEELSQLGLKSSATQSKVGIV